MILFEDILYLFFSFSLFDPKMTKTNRNINNNNMNNNHNHNNTNDEAKLVWVRHFSAGICAGIVSRTCTAPIDRLRTFFQGREND